MSTLGTVMDQFTVEVLRRTVIFEVLSTIYVKVLVKYS